MSEGQNKVGRKPKINRDEVREIIHLYRTEKAVTGKIKYMEVFEFNKEMYDGKRVNILMGEDFWRKSGRLGKDMIDQANEVFAHKISSIDEKSKLIPRVVDIVNKHYDDKNEMAKRLLPLEQGLRNSYKKEQKLLEEIYVLKSNLTKQKEKYDGLKNDFQDIQDVLFKMLRYSTSKKGPIKNHLSMGKGKSDIVKDALEGIFTFQLISIIGTIQKLKMQITLFY
ncbi:hypothetical protein AB4Z22_09595 [Paenibacillus sp. TAF58]